MNPTVSTYMTRILLGRLPPWTVTSRVVNSWSLDTNLVSLVSPVSAFIRVVFPGIKQNETIIETAI